MKTLYFVLGCLCLVLLLWTFHAVQAQTPPPRQPAPILTASEINVVDRLGHARIHLGLRTVKEVNGQPVEQPELRMYNTEGQERVRILINDKGEAQLLMTSPGVKLSRLSFLPPVGSGQRRETP